jgi:hypothetical protein
VPTDPPLEADFQASVIQDAEIAGGRALKLEPGTGNIPKGWPDLLVMQGQGRYIWCELKTKGGTVSPMQRHTLLLLCKSGYDVCFMDPRPEYCVPCPMTPEEIETYEPPR